MSYTIQTIYFMIADGTYYPTQISSYPQNPPKTHLIRPFLHTIQTKYAHVVYFSVSQWPLTHFLLKADILSFTQLYKVYWILLFPMCFGIFSSFHLAKQITFIQNRNCSKMHKNACADMIFELPSCWSPCNQTACPYSACWRRSHAQWRHPVATKAWWGCHRSTHAVEAAHGIGGGGGTHGLLSWKSIPRDRRALKKACPAAFICVFMTVWILNWYNLNA